MTARETLAEAHKRMTPEQIAAHALELADVVELYRAVIDARQKAMAHAGATVESGVKTVNYVVAEAKHINSLFAAHRKVEARRRLAVLAGAPLLPDPGIPHESEYRLMPLPAGLFRPISNDNSEPADV